MTGPQDLESLLAQLAEVELLERSPEQDPAYLFKHALTQETAYASLLRKRRRAIHLLIAQAYEQLYGDRLDENAALLAHHYEEAGDEAKTLEYSRRAGDAAARIYASAEALIHYTRALELAKRALGGAAAVEPGAASIAGLLPLYMGRGRALEMAGRWDEALANYEEVETRARARGEGGVELAALLARGGIHATPNPAHDAGRAQALLEQALALARALPDRPAQARVLWLLLLLHTFDGRPRRAIEYGEEGLALARDLDMPELVAYVLNGLFMAYWPAGYPARAWDVLNEGRALWSAQGNLLMLAENHTRTGLIQFAEGDYGAAIASSDEAFRLAQSISHLWGQANSRSMVGSAYMERGEPERAVAVMEEALALGEQSRHPAVLVLTRADLGYLYGRRGEVERGLALARAAAAHAAIAYPLLRPWALAAVARLLVLAGDLDAAGQAVAEARAILNTEGSFHSPIFVYSAEAELALALGEHERAAGAADGLLAYLAQVGWRTYRPDALLYKAQACAGLGRTAEAARLFGEARAAAQEIGAQRSLAAIAAALRA